jgi:hypothetical protein
VTSLYCAIDRSSVKATARSSHPAATLALYMPGVAASRTTIVLGAPGPWRLIELGLVDLPYASRAPKERQCNRAADWQQIMRPNLRHAAPRTQLGRVTLAGTAKSGRS